LSSQYKIRAVTRVPSKPAAQALQERGVEVVKADLYDRESLDKALRGAHTVFGMVTTTYDDSIYTKEIIRSKNLADAAVAAGVQYIIYSNDGTYVIFNTVPPQSAIECYDPVADTGKFTNVILAEPDKFEGKTLCAAAYSYSFEDIAELISTASGKTVKYKQISVDEYDRMMPVQNRIIGDLMLYVSEHGCFHPNEEEHEWATKHIGKLTTFEEYLQKNPLELQ
ncbi:hypothetical protein BX616_006001, partial [Lobosporangium transversale]